MAFLSVPRWLNKAVGFEVARGSAEARGRSLLSPNKSANTQTGLTPPELLAYESLHLHDAPLNYAFFHSRAVTLLSVRDMLMLFENQGTLSLY